MLMAIVPLEVIGEFVTEVENVAGAANVRPTLVTDPGVDAKSAATSFLQLGEAGDPVLGPARTVLAVSAIKVGTSVPAEVTGDPVTLVLKITPSPVMPTLVTLPPPGETSS